MRKHKVYGWQGYRSDCKPAPNGSQQTREICATTSIKRLCQILGCTRNEFMNLCETGNMDEIRIAMAEPGVIFWRSINILGKSSDTDWTRVKK